MEPTDRARKGSVEVTCDPLPKSLAACIEPVYCGSPCRFLKNHGGSCQDMYGRWFRYRKDRSK